MNRPVTLVTSDADRDFKRAARLALVAQLQLLGLFAFYALYGASLTIDLAGHGPWGIVAPGLAILSTGLLAPAVLVGWTVRRAERRVPRLVPRWLRVFLLLEAAWFAVPALFTAWLFLPSTLWALVLGGVTIICSALCLLAALAFPTDRQYREAHLWPESPGH